MRHHQHRHGGSARFRAGSAAEIGDGAAHSNTATRGGQRKILRKWHLHFRRAHVGALASPTATVQKHVTETKSPPQNKQLGVHTNDLGVRDVRHAWLGAEWVGRNSCGRRRRRRPAATPSPRQADCVSPPGRQSHIAKAPPQHNDPSIWVGCRLRSFRPCAKTTRFPKVWRHRAAALGALPVRREASAANMVPSGLLRAGSEC